jgi:CRP-like cAMP-binding protein
MISSYPPPIRRQMLSKHFLISTMPEGALDDLVKFTTVARFEPHRVIFSKGDKGDCLYGILSGRVRIYSNSAEGAEIMLNVLEQGDLFGEIALLDGSTRTASAAAMEQTDLLRIHRAHFLPYVKANPDLILAMLTLLCQRLRWRALLDAIAQDASPPSRMPRVSRRKRRCRRDPSSRESPRRAARISAWAGEPRPPRRRRCGDRPAPRCW